MKLEHTTTAKPILTAPSLDADSSPLTALEVSEVRYRRLFEAARDGILILDATTSKITDSNPFMTELLGYSREELYGKELADIGVFQDKGAAHAAMAQLHRDSYIRYGDLPLETKSHERRAVEFVSNVYSENGKDVIQCNIRDISERKLLETEQARMAAIVSTSDDLIYSKDVSGIILTWNEAGERLYGYTAAEIVGQTYSKFVPDTHVAEYAEVMNRFRNGEVIAPFDTMSKRRDGTLIEVNTRISPLRNLQGALTGASVITRDITEQSAQSARIAKAQVETLALNARLRRAMAETHHRVKNNLQMIAAMIDIQLMEATDTVPTSVVMRFGTQVQALATLHDLLTDESKKDVEARSLDAHDVLSKLLPLIQATVRTKIAFQGDHARFAVSQAASLCLIANEIVTNAIKHGRDTVNIIFRADDRDAELVVEDDGPGFPRDFDPDTMSNHGLEMACQMARTDLAGSIVFETRDGGGGRVTLKMPHYGRVLLKEVQSSFASFDDPSS
jgi:PAS domain S-box-containing protein